MIEPAVIEATVDRAEMQRNLGALGRHLTRSAETYLSLLTIWIVVALYAYPFITFPLVQRLPPESWVWAAPAVNVIVPAILVLVGIFALNNWHVRGVERDFGRAWDARGVPTQLGVTFRIDEDAFRVLSARVDLIARWPAVTELYRSPDGWLLTSDISSLYVPASAFATPDDERAFVRRVLERMPAEARERSNGARDYVGEFG